MDDRVVPLEDGVGGEAPEPGQREDALRDHDPRDEERQAHADGRDDRHRGVLQRVREEDPARPLALGVRRADVVGVQHLQHAGAGDPRDERHVDQAERQRRQDEVAREGPEPAGERRVALHRQEVEADREAVDHQEAEPEDGDRESADREDHDRPVDPGPRPPGRQDARGGQRVLPRRRAWTGRERPSARAAGRSGCGRAGASGATARGRPGPGCATYTPSWT